MDTAATFSQERWDELWHSLQRKSSPERAPEPSRDDLWEEERWTELVPLVVRDLVRATRNHDGEAELESLACLAVLFGLLDLCDESSLLWRRAFLLRREYEDSTEVDAELYLLAGPLAHSSKPEEAVPVYRAGIEANRLLRDQEQVFLGLANLGSLFQCLGRWQEALDCFEEALALAPDGSWSCWSRGRILEGLSEVHQGLGDLAEAIWFQQETIACLDQLEEKVAAAECSVRLGELHALTGRPADGRAVIMNAIMALEALGEEQKAAQASMAMWDMD